MLLALLSPMSSFRVDSLFNRIFAGAPASSACGLVDDCCWFLAARCRSYVVMLPATAGDLWRPSRKSPSWTPVAALHRPCAGGLPSVGGGPWTTTSFFCSAPRRSLSLPWTGFFPPGAVSFGSFLCWSSSYDMVTQCEAGLSWWSWQKFGPDGGAPPGPAANCDSSCLSASHIRRPRSSASLYCL